MNEKNKTTFFRGIPTDIDIKKLKERWPAETLTPGKLIHYDEVEDLLQIKKRSFRFRTVTFRWRRMIENESNIFIGCERGIGFKVLDEPEKLDLSGDNIRRAGRAAGRAITVASRIDRKKLEDHERAALDHIAIVGAKILASNQRRSGLELPSI